MITSRWRSTPHIAPLPSDISTCVVSTSPGFSGARLISALIVGSLILGVVVGDAHWWGGHASRDFIAEFLLRAGSGGHRICSAKQWADYRSLASGCVWTHIDKYNAQSQEPFSGQRAVWGRHCQWCGQSSDSRKRILWRRGPRQSHLWQSILDVDQAKTVVVVKRSLSPGFAGIPESVVHQWQFVDGLWRCQKCAPTIDSSNERIIRFAVC